MTQQRLHLPASLLPMLAENYKVQVDERVGRPVRACGPASQLQRSIERINELPRTKQKFVIEMLATVLAHANG